MSTQNSQPESVDIASRKFDFPTLKFHKVIDGKNVSISAKVDGLGNVIIEFSADCFGFNSLNLGFRDPGNLSAGDYVKLAELFLTIAEQKLIVETPAK